MCDGIRVKSNNYTKLSQRTLFEMISQVI